tara:strand:- start:6884 stop:9526 length:2643 start_codon:yes stop_codon:yes gene_type:complete
VVVSQTLITQAVGLTLVSDCEATTNFAGFRHSGGGTPSPGSEVNVFVQDTQAISIKVSGATRDEGIWFDIGTASGAVDMTATADKHVYLWAAMTDMAQADGIAAGGFFIIIASSTTTWNKYYMNGSDTIDGRFVRYVLDVNKTPSETSATAATLTAVTHIGIGVKGTITAKAENLVLDRIDYGTGLTIQGGDAIDGFSTWQELFDADDAILNKWGIIEKRGTVFYLKGGIEIGNAASTVTTEWIDATNAVVEFEDPRYYNGAALVSSVTAADLYKITLAGNATGLTDVRWGEAIGAGDDRQGVLGGAIRSAGPKWTFDTDTDIADIDSVEVYGLQIQGAGTCSFDVASKTFVIGVTFVNCDEVIPNVCEWLNNAIVAPKPDRGMEFDAVQPTTAKLTKFVFSSSNITFVTQQTWVVDVSATPDLFLDMTSEFSDNGVGNLLLMPAAEAAGDYTAFGSDQKFGRMRFDFNTTGVGGTVIWEYWNGSAWSSLTVTADESNGFTTGGNNRDIDWNVPADWAAVSLHDESPLFYARVRVLTVFSTNPTANTGEFRRTVEHMVNHPIAGTVGYIGMEFFGSGVLKFDVENSIVATAVGIPNLNDDDTDQIVGDTIDGVAESFTGSVGTLSSIEFRGRKVGAPTGNAICYLYAHSGTLGFTSIPTGAALATSEPLAVSSLLTGIDLVYKFNFLDEFLLAATNYCFAIEYTAGDATNHLIVRYDATSGAPLGNKSTLAASTWTPQSGHDVVYSIARGGVVTIDASEGSDPVEWDATGDPPGVVIINNAVTLTVTVEDEAGVALVGVRVGIYTDDANNTELMNEDTIAGGIATQPFSFSSDQDITVRVRESPNTASGRYIPFFTRGTITVDGYSVVVILQDDPIASVT